MVEPTIAGSGDHDQRKTPPRTSDGSFEVPAGLRPLFDRRATYAFDLAVMGLAFGLAYLLRFEFAVPLEIVHGKRSVTAHTALPPARLFGTSERSG